MFTHKIKKLEKKFFNQLQDPPSHNQPEWPSMYSFPNISIYIQRKRQTNDTDMSFKSFVYDRMKRNDLVLNVKESLTSTQLRTCNSFKTCFRTFGTTLFQSLIMRRRTHVTKIQVTQSLSLPFFPYCLNFTLCNIMLEVKNVCLANDMLFLLEFQ